MPPDDSDETLLKRACGGDEDAFTELYRRRQGGIYRFTLQMTGSEPVAEEVTQEVFMTVVRGMDGFDAARGSVQSWLYGIARNCAMRHFRREQPTVGLDQWQESGAATDEDRGESIEAVRRAVLGLPNPFREAVVLCDLQELSYAEAAEAAGVPVGTVRSRLSRGRALLAEFFRSSALRCLV